MKAEELRIGNYVSILNEIFPLTKKRLVRVLTGGYQVDPILITEELLIKAGFKIEPNDDKDNADYFYNTIFIQYHKDVDDFICCNIYPDHLQVKYFHHLQNIIFDLSGKELKI
jgi:hypothetical protein